MKAIEQISVFHGKAYHERFFKLEFGQLKCRFFESESKVGDKTHRSHKQADLISCEVLEDD